MKIVSVAEMQLIERQADASGLSYSAMMENAGRGLAEYVHFLKPASGMSRVMALVGPGNNGGDALVALAYLAGWGWQVQAFLARPRPADPLVERLLQAGGLVLEAASDPRFELLADALAGVDVLLDGLLGTGAKPPLRPDLAELLVFVQQTVSALNISPRVIAVDCPSGIDCDTGDAPPETLRADATVTMAAVKQGLLSPQAGERSGVIQLAGIGRLDGLPAWEAVHRICLEADYVRQVLPARPADAHKGTFGTALICAGSMQYTGAAWLAGQSAYRSGAGLVTIAAPEPAYYALAGHIPEATWLILPHQAGWIAPEAAAMLLNNLGRATALLIGPGWGLDAGTAEFLSRILQPRKQGAALPPVVVDADGLKLLARLPGWHTLLPPLSILTPHPGEMSILTGLTTGEINANRLKIAERFAADWGQVVVLKGAYTVIASPDGRCAVVPVASAALARAGTGDVLAGITVGLRAQGVPAFEAAAAAAFLHARAGLLAAERLGAASTLAGDVLHALPEIIRKIAPPKSQVLTHGAL